MKQYSLIFIDKPAVEDKWGTHPKKCIEHIVGHHKWLVVCVWLGGLLYGSI